MDADQIIDLLDTLTPAELRRVYARAAELVAQLDEWQRPIDDEHALSNPSRTFRQEYVKCGKAGCAKCSASGPGHGPYWYAYWSEGGRTRKEYLGKHAPVGTEQQGTNNVT